MKHVDHHTHGSTTDPPGCQAFLLSCLHHKVLTDHAGPDWQRLGVHSGVQFCREVASKPNDFQKPFQAGARLVELTEFYAEDWEYGGVRQGVCHQCEYHSQRYQPRNQHKRHTATREGERERGRGRQQRWTWLKSASPDNKLVKGETMLHSPFWAC